MKILIINGSPRKKSYSRVLATFIYEYVKENHKDAELLDLGKNPIELFRGEGDYNEQTKKVKDSLKDFDIFIICSPVYNGFFSSAIKNLFEFADPKELEGKVAGFVLMATGRISYLQVQSQLSSLMNYFSIISNPKAAHIDGAAFNENQEITDEDVKKRLKKLIDSTIDIKK